MPIGQIQRVIASTPAAVRTALMETWPFRLAVQTGSIEFTIEEEDGAPCFVVTQTTNYGEGEEYQYIAKVAYVDAGFGSPAPRRVWWSEGGAQGEVQVGFPIAQLEDLSYATAWDSAVPVMAEFLHTFIDGETPQVLNKEIGLGSDGRLEWSSVVWRIDDGDDKPMYSTWTYQAGVASGTFGGSSRAIDGIYALPLQGATMVNVKAELNSGRIADALEAIAHTNIKIAMNNGRVIFNATGGSVDRPGPDVP